MLDFLKQLFGKKEKVQFLGILGERNYANVHEFQEVVAKAASVVWTEKTPDQWRTFLSQYQYSSSSCVAFTIAKLAQVLYFLKTGRKVKFSPGWVYKQRDPKVEGMWIDNAVAIAGGGLPTEELYPSEGLSETQINNLPDLPYTNGVAKEFAISVNWINLPLDFETVASTIQATNKGIMLWFKFGGNNEWFGNSIPAIKGSKTPYRHSVCAVDAVLYKGRKYLVIEDSADVDGSFGHRKLIDKTFFEERCELARYPVTFKFDQTAKPHYDGSVKSLQDCLKFEGVLASNIDSTGYYGSLTTQAVKDFQRRYNIPQTGNVGSITSQKLVDLFP